MTWSGLWDKTILLGDVYENSFYIERYHIVNAETTQTSHLIDLRDCLLYTSGRLSLTHRSLNIVNYINTQKTFNPIPDPTNEANSGLD